MASSSTKKSAQYLMYTMNGCSYCNQARALFQYYNVAVDLKYEKAPDWPTFPCVYKVTEDGPELIGGFSELAAYSYDHGL